MLKIVADDADRDDLAVTLDELVTEGARRMLMTGLEIEVADYIERHQQLVDADGLRLVVRNGKAAERTLVTGAGALKVRAPRVHDRPEGHRVSSYILPKYAGRSPKVADVLPVLYLRGLSTGDFAPALEEFFGSDAGLSGSSITRLVETWTDEYQAFAGRDLSGSDYGELWADVLRDLKERGMGAPRVAVGDGALGFWAALGDVFPDTVEQRCWVHKTANILDALTQRLHRQAKAAIPEIYQAEARRDGNTGIDEFTRIYSAKHPKAVT